MNRRQTTAQLLALLDAKHSRDVFVPECKDGPTHGAKHLRMDAWVLRRSWAKPLTIAYEIKSDRADFTKDEKWRHYLPYCNEFFFVAPAGIIAPAELPGEVGLIVASKNLARLYTKKRASYREVELPDSLWRYIVMCRARIGQERDAEKEGTLSYWRKWLEERKLSREMGWRVSRALRQVIDERITAVEVENHRLKRENEGLAEIKRMMERLELSPHGYISEDQLRRKLGRAIPTGLDVSLRYLENQLGRFRKELERACEVPGNHKPADAGEEQG